MHHWGDEGVDWDGINEAALYIGTTLKKWGRIPVRDYKEKYGTVRVCCGFGAHNFFWFFHPGHIYYRWPRWFRWFDYRVGRHIFRLINKFLIPYQIWFYKRTYRKAVEKWPHLEQEIVCMADYREVIKRDFGDLMKEYIFGKDFWAKS